MKTAYLINVNENTEKCIESIIYDFVCVVERIESENNLFFKNIDKYDLIIYSTKMKEQDFVFIRDIKQNTNLKYVPLIVLYLESAKYFPSEFTIYLDDKRDLSIPLPMTKYVFEKEIRDFINNTYPDEYMK